MERCRWMGPGPGDTTRYDVQTGPPRGWRGGRPPVSESDVRTPRDHRKRTQSPGVQGGGVEERYPTEGQSEQRRRILVSESPS